MDTATILKLLELWGLARADIETRLNGIAAKYPDHPIPVSEVRAFLSQYLSPEVIQKWIHDSVAPALVSLVTTGKGPIGPSDGSAFA